MVQYGVQRLILINSGNYGFTEVDLTRSVHLVAPNNRGKTTLVNALQFLYINDMRHMKFANTAEETAKHYFGCSPSYLVFECASPIGTKSLLVRGLSRLQAGSFERYIYDGGFRTEDFVEPDGRIREFTAVQESLSDRHLKTVPNNALWKVLSGEATDKQDVSGGLKILPIRNQGDYRNFCRVYRKLLTLADLDSDRLRELLIACHSRDISERRIDIATDYRDAFELAERTEHELTFIQSSASLITEGHKARERVATLMTHLTEKVPANWQRAQALIVRLRAWKEVAESRISELEDRRQTNSQQKDRLLKDEGATEERLATATREKNELLKQEQRWSSYTDAMIATMRKNAEALRRKIERMEGDLSDAEAHDIHALERQVEDTERQIARDQRAFDDWENTFAAYLMKNGFNENQLDTIFRIVNTSAHNAIVGDELTIKEETALQKQIQSLLEQTEEHQFDNDILSVDLSRHDSIDARALLDPSLIQSKIQLAAKDLQRKKSRLEIAHDREAARRRLAGKRAQLKESETELNDYDRFGEALQERPELEERESSATQELESIRRDLTSIEESLRQIADELTGTTTESQECDSAAANVKDVFNQLRTELESLGHHTDLIPTADVAPVVATEKPEIDLPSTLTEVKSILAQTREIVGDAKVVSTGNLRVKDLEQKIINASREFPGQQIYFEERDSEWDLLVQKAESLEELHETARKAWDDLFTTLSGRLDGLLRGVREIQKAVHRLNSSLKSYQVSNLKSVDLKVSTDNSTYRVISELCSEDGLFQNKDELENAKKQLRNWITNGKELTIDSLFGLQISGVQSDGSPIHASSLDRIGSTGTGMTIKAMILTNLTRAIAPDPKYHLHFFIDETGRLDDPNLAATTRMAVSQSIIPITAEPKVKLESLAHPEVIVYTLDQGSDGRFRINSRRSFRARRVGGDATGG